ncbi:hypothetical protein Zm00014a_004435, partial [Zea mays]
STRSVIKGRLGVSTRLGVLIVQSSD